MKTFGWMGSIRSWIALLVTVAFCGLALLGKVEINKFYDIVMLVMLFYFLKERPAAKVEPPKSPTVR